MDMNEDTVMDLEFGWFHTFFFLSMFFFLLFFLMRFVLECCPLGRA